MLVSIKGKNRHFLIRACIELTFLAPWISRAAKGMARMARITTKGPTNRPRMKPRVLLVEKLLSMILITKY